MDVLDGNKITGWIILITSVLLIIACGFSDSKELWRDGPYIVIWIDNPNNITLNYDVGNGGSVQRVGSRVVSVGSNERYVVVKQITKSAFETVNYYVIERKKDNKFSDISKAVIGPLLAKEYEKEKSLKMLPNFSKEF